MYKHTCFGLYHLYVSNGGLNPIGYAHEGFSCKIYQSDLILYLLLERDDAIKKSEIVATYNLVLCIKYQNANDQMFKVRKVIKTQKFKLAIEQQNEIDVSGPTNVLY